MSCRNVKLRIFGHFLSSQWSIITHRAGDLSALMEGHMYIMSMMLNSLKRGYTSGQGWIRIKVRKVNSLCRGVFTDVVHALGGQIVWHECEAKLVYE